MATDALRVLIVEDDFSIRRLLAESLGAHAIRPIEAADLAAARQAMSAEPMDLLLLDLGSPDGDGVRFIRELRAWTDVPVLVLSARNLERDKIAALDAGADDYLAKPFATGELLARVRALARRIRRERSETVFRSGDLCIDFALRQVNRDGQPVHLSPTEFRVLSQLASRPGRVLTYRQILQEAWGSSSPDQFHYVRIVVANLRRKLEVDSTQPRLLLTEIGVGYRWHAQ